MSIAMLTAPPPTFSAPMSTQPLLTVQALVSDEAKAPPPVRLYPSQHRVSMTRYATSTDPRGYIPVFEYPLNGQYIMIDCETGMVHFTGIWKALGHTKADVVKLVESDPTIGPYLRKVRGGYLKIQGTWLPFDTARTLARRVAWQLRYDLIPLFGPEFPDTCLGPGEPGFGQLLLSAPKPRGRRGAKKASIASSNDSSHKNTQGAHEGVLGSAPYRPSDTSAAQPLAHSYRSEGLGPVPVYSPHVSQARYSPYSRPPSHGITQLEPLPSLVQPHQARSIPQQSDNHMYGTYGRNPLNSSMGHLDHPPVNQTPGSTGRLSSGHLSHPNSLPSLRNMEQNLSTGNFFETYRGPDSFETLSNRWLGPESNGCGSLTDINGDPNAIRRCSSSPLGLPPRRDPTSHPMDHYSFPATVDHTQPDPQQRPACAAPERGSTYPYRYDSEFPSGLAVEDLNRRPSSAPGFPPPGVYNSEYSSEVHEKSNSHAEKVLGYGHQQTGSPNSHSSHVATGTTPKSPSPSSASTSTHLYHSHQRHRSSQHTLGGLSSNGNEHTSQANDVNHFSVLTSPAHLDQVFTPAVNDNSGGGLQCYEADWNSTRNSNTASESYLEN